MNPSYSPYQTVSSRPLTRGAMTSVYGLVMLALLMTLVGTGLGMTVLLQFVTGPTMLVLFLAEIALIFTSQMWSRIPTWNVVLFLAFPLLSGLTITPILITYVATYANGLFILVNALIATTLLTGAAAIVSSVIRTDLWGTFGLFLMQGLIGLIIFSLLQLFIPALRGPAAETVISAIGIVLFSVFLAADMQRLRRIGATNPFMLALSLYLDIFNLFLYVLRFMGAMSQNR